MTSGPFFIYRLPGGGHWVVGKECQVVMGLRRGSFAVCGFLPGSPVFSFVPAIVEEREVGLCREGSSSKGIVPEEPELKPDAAYLEAVSEIISEMRLTGGKTVFARSIDIEVAPGTELDLEATLETLAFAHPEAMVFAFGSPRTGTWFGASPEKLLGGNGEEWSTVSLAGTRPRSGVDKPWDRKNLEEQAMVTDFILSVLRAEDLAPATEGPFTSGAGQIEHLKTAISFNVSGIASGRLEPMLTGLLHRLSPTPALCGSDREFSLSLIVFLETRPREMYGGWCGPYASPRDFLFHVNLRSAKLLEHQARLYCGGGVTPLSTPEEEWKETCRKSRTIADALRFQMGTPKS